LSKHYLDGTDFTNMIRIGTQKLQENVAKINALNVFPVPDGDTGTNMGLTLQSGIQEMRRKPSGHLGQIAEALSRGLLMGARGNSGVILSQLFRGFAKSVHGLEQANIEQLTLAFQHGVETAYQAVVKPVEGTILTVSKQAAKRSMEIMNNTEDIVDLFREVKRAAQEALDYTPEQLPILKQVGVVDAGGQGLVFIYDGFVQALAGEIRTDFENDDDEPVTQSTISAQAHFATGDIEFGYCTEFIVCLKPEVQSEFNEPQFRLKLGKLGDSLLVVADGDLVKVHIHAEYPGTVMNHAMKFGDLTRIKIENMREQHTHILQDAYAASEQSADDVVTETKAFGMLAVAAGEGIRNIFISLGVDAVIAGGQSMNPSTEDILREVGRIPADLIFIFPNNSNIILAAEQAGRLSNKEVRIIPSKTIPQGLSAVLSFREDIDAATNEAAMMSATKRVRSGLITMAIRDSIIDQLEIRTNDFLGLMDNDIVASDRSIQQVSEVLLERMIERGNEVVTLFYGEDAHAEWTAGIQAFIEKRYPDIELEIHSGGQPLNYYIISVE
jgi:DAK2 domain fusion protein YloV